MHTTDVDADNSSTAAQKYFLQLDVDAERTGSRKHVAKADNLSRELSFTVTTPSSVETLTTVLAPIFYDTFHTPLVDAGNQTLKAIKCAVPWVNYPIVLDGVEATQGSLAAFLADGMDGSSQITSTPNALMRSGPAGRLQRSPLSCGYAQRRST